MDKHVLRGKKGLSQDPIFIVGYPRSGTTLLQSLLATQGNIVTFPETHFFYTLRTKYENTTETVQKSRVWEFLQEITRVSGVEFSESDIVPLGDLDWISTKELFEFIVWKFLPENVPNDFRWLEKTPDHAFFLEDIGSFYPNAKFVGIVRHPFPAIFSRTRYFPPKTQDLLGFLSRQWVVYAQSLEEFKKAYPEKIMLIKYEDLVQSPLDVTSTIADFLSVPFNPGALSQRVQVADTIIQPFEHWKADVRNPEIRNTNREVKGLFSLGDRLKIQSIVCGQMRRYGYAGTQTFLQLVYQLCFLWLPSLLKRVMSQAKKISGHL